MHLLTLLLVLMFALVIAYFCYCVYFYGGRWVANLLPLEEAVRRVGAAAVLRAWGAPFVRVYALFPDGRIEAAEL